MHPVIRAWGIWNHVRCLAARRPHGRSPRVQYMLERTVVWYREHLDWLLSFDPK